MMLCAARFGLSEHIMAAGEYTRSTPKIYTEIDGSKVFRYDGKLAGIYKLRSYKFTKT
jgi:hypothetical protein